MIVIEDDLMKLSKKFQPKIRRKNGGNKVHAIESFFYSMF